MRTWDAHLDHFCLDALHLRKDSEINQVIAINKSVQLYISKVS